MNILKHIFDLENSFVRTATESDFAYSELYHLFYRKALDNKAVNNNYVAFIF